MQWWREKNCPCQQLPGKDRFDSVPNISPALSSAPPLEARGPFGKWNVVARVLTRAFDFAIPLTALSGKAHRKLVNAPKLNRTRRAFSFQNLRLLLSTCHFLKPKISAPAPPPFEGHDQVPIQLAWDVPKLTSPEPSQKGLSKLVQPHP